MNIGYSMCSAKSVRAVGNCLQNMGVWLWQRCLYAILLLLTPNVFASTNGVFTTPSSDMQIKDNQDFLVVLKKLLKK